MTLTLRDLFDATDTHCSVCAPSEWSIAQVEEAVNRVYPRAERWTVSRASRFLTEDRANPSPCKSADRTHYLLETRAREVA